MELMEHITVIELQPKNLFSTLQDQKGLLMCKGRVICLSQNFWMVIKSQGTIRFYIENCPSEFNSRSLS